MNNLIHKITMYSFKNKNVLITGWGTGIGKWIAHISASWDANVCIIWRTESTLKSCVEEMEHKWEGHKVYKVCDVTNDSQIKEVIDWIVSERWSLDYAANNAWIIQQPAPIAENNDREAARKLLDINVLWVHSCMHYELQQMIKQWSGSIVNTCSTAAHGGLPTMAIYAASKYAVEWITKTAALEVADKWIRVNCIAPWPTDTPMLDDVEGMDAEQMAKQVPMGELVRPWEAAEIVTFLFSDHSSGITWEKITVGKGWKIAGSK